MVVLRIRSALFLSLPFNPWIQHPPPPRGNKYLKIFFPPVPRTKLTALLRVMPSGGADLSTARGKLLDLQDVMFSVTISRLLEGGDNSHPLLNKQGERGAS